MLRRASGSKCTGHRKQCDGLAFCKIGNLEIIGSDGAGLGRRFYEFGQSAVRYAITDFNGHGVLQWRKERETAPEWRRARTVIIRRRRRPCERRNATASNVAASPR